MNVPSRVWKTRIVTVVAAVILIWAASHFIFASAGSGPHGLKLAKISKGDIAIAVSASGTLEPEEVIDVGAQVAGKILTFGQDRDGKEIDYGSAVDENMVLARIDDSLYQADAAQASADFARSKAELTQAQVKLEYAERDWKRAQEIGHGPALALTQLDAYKNAYETSKAGILVAEAAVGLSQAAVDKAQNNLNYCVIRSPVAGTIIDKRVNIGQTVVSSLNAPSLFLLAKDLTKMQLWVSVNEADIGVIKPGQSVHFTIDAFPGEDFVGTVEKIRLNASMVQNVVTYVVEVDTDNSSKRLLPYLTANARFEVNTNKDVLLVPNPALRWTPDQTLIDPDAKLPDQLTKKPGVTESIIWVPNGRYVRPIRVTVKGNDDAMTEVSGDELEEGLDIVVGKSERGDPKAKDDSAGTNPFAPQVMRGGRRG